MSENKHQARKACKFCGLPFSWRFELDRDWSALKFCSPRCRSAHTNLHVNQAWQRHQPQR